MDLTRVPQQRARENTCPVDWRLRRWLVVFLFLALLRGELYTLVIPPWQHPDEPTQFEHIRLIAEMGRLPAPNTVSLPLRYEIAGSMLEYNFWKGIGQPDLNDATLSRVGMTPLGIYTLTQPKLYYALAALWLRPLLSWPVEQQLYWVRMFSVVLNLVVILAVFATARRVWPDRPELVLAALGFVVLLPSQTDIMAAANNDAFVNAFAAWFFFVLAVVYQQGLTWPRAACAVLLLVAAFLSKATALTLLLTLPLALIFYPRRTVSFRAGVMGSLLLGIALLSLGAVAFRSTADSFLRPLLQSMDRYVRADLVLTVQAIFNPEASWRYIPVTIGAFQSFWAAYGWGHVRLSPEWYWLLLVGTLLSGGGLVRMGLERLRRHLFLSWRSSYLWFGTGALIVASLMAVLRSQAVQGMTRYMSHGRYALVAIVPFAIAFVWGLDRWMPGRWKRASVAVYWSLWFGFEALAFWGYLIPYYYGNR